MLTLELGKNFPRSVARTIVHANQFHLLGHRQDALHNRAQESALVVNRHDD